MFRYVLAVGFKCTQVLPLMFVTSRRAISVCGRNGFGSSVNAACNHRFRNSFFSDMLISCTVLFLFPTKDVLVCSSGRMPLLDLDVGAVVLQ